ncbi:MAG: glycine cleavage T C-terminal barrel domain-containing protein [Planctomycetota bacterium]
MLHESPLRNSHRQYADRLTAEKVSMSDAASEQRPGAAHGSTVEAETTYLPFGPGDAGGDAYEVLGSLGTLEAEYAAFRRGAAILDSPHRGTVVLTGPERIDFLNRMITQELASLEEGRAVESFWLNRKGRIEADLLVVHTENATLLLVDRHQAEVTTTSLSSFIIMEDAAIRDASDDWFHLAVHGPNALDVLAHASGDDEVHIAPLACGAINLAGVECTVVRRDLCGVPGIEILVPIADKERVWNALVSADETVGEGKRRVRPSGWFAFNIARIEAGAALFNIDFGSSTLPHESGVFASRVSLTKGCYLGQEVVARMQSRGKAKQSLVRLDLTGEELPVAGAQVFAADDGAMATPVGVVTSSTLSPMLGAKAIAFAMVRAAHATEGDSLRVSADGTLCDATVQPSLAAWTEAAT